jgi:hypothetical protein
VGISQFGSSIIMLKGVLARVVIAVGDEVEVLEA